MTRVAFLGLGAIGAPMASHLSGPPFELTVWNRTRERAKGFVSNHAAHIAATPMSAGNDVEFAITCLPSSREVEEVLFSDEGLAQSLAPGATLIDCTSGDPASSRRIAERLAQQGVDFLDAPVSGGVAGASAGTLTVMCGGNETVFERCRPVLEAFGKKIVRCGDVGAGHAVKAVSNALLAVHVWSLGEALASLAKIGVDTSVALDVISASAGRSNASQNLFPERAMTRAFPRTFRLALLDKDIDIAARIARDAGVPIPLIELTAKLIRGAHGELGEEADHVEAVKVIEERAGVQIS
ncbi:MAG TPA: NAD(P)-dependent oxidoreductase [Gemmatimonadaceae bacterium]